MLDTDTTSNSLRSAKFRTGNISLFLEMHRQISKVTLGKLYGDILSILRHTNLLTKVGRTSYV